MSVEVVEVVVVAHQFKMEWWYWWCIYHWIRYHYISNNYSSYGEGFIFQHFFQDGRGTIAFLYCFIFVLRLGGLAVTWGWILRSSIWDRTSWWQHTLLGCNHQWCTTPGECHSWLTTFLPQKGTFNTFLSGAATIAIGRFGF